MSSDPDTLVNHLVLILLDLSRARYNLILIFFHHDYKVFISVFPKGF